MKGRRHPDRQLNRKMRQTDSLTRKDGETDTHTAERHTDTLPN